jgi:hypothetical protein
VCLQVSLIKGNLKLINCIFKKVVKIINGKITIQNKVKLCRDY